MSAQPSLRVVAAAETASDLRHFRRHQHMAREGEERDSLFRLEDGWACRYRTLSSGRRQITALFLPGEYCEPQWLLEPRATGSIVALTSVRARHMALSLLSPSAPGGRDNTANLLSATLDALNRQAEWIVTLGRKTALERICATLGDILERLRNAGRAANDCYPLPLTQADLADIVGLTPVHVNRVLKTLRTAGVVELHGRDLRVPDPELLHHIGSGALPLKMLDNLPKR